MPIDPEGTRTHFSPLALEEGRGGIEEPTGRPRDSAGGGGEEDRLLHLRLGVGRHQQTRHYRQPQFGLRNVAPRRHRCQPFRAAGAQQLCSTKPCEPPHVSPPALMQCPATRGFVVGAVVGIPRWHARGQGFMPPRPTAAPRVFCARCVPAASTGDRGLAAELQVSRLMCQRESAPSQGGPGGTGCGS